MKQVSADRMRRGYENRENGASADTGGKLPLPVAHEAESPTLPAAPGAEVVSEEEREALALPSGVATARGVMCQNAACRGRTSIVVKSYTRKNQTEMLRVRECKACGLRYKTVETVEPVPQKQWTEDLKGRLIRKERG